MHEGQDLVRVNQLQLAKPRGYILRLIEAGLVAGAATIDIDSRSGRIEFTGVSPVTLPPEALAQLVTVLVAPHHGLPGTITQEAMAQLAIGALGALRSSATRVSIESVDDRGVGSTLHIEATAGYHMEPVLDGRPGTRIRILGLDTFERERELLKAHCSSVETPISLDSDLISGNPVTTGMLIARVPVTLRGAVIGQAFAYENGRWGGIRVLSAGLLLESFSNQECGRGVWVNLELPLPRDISGTELVRGPELDEAMAAASDACTKLPRPSAPRSILNDPASVQPPTFDAFDLLAIAILLGSLTLGIILESPMTGGFIWLASAGLAVGVKHLRERDKEDQ